MSVVENDRQQASSFASLRMTRNHFLDSLPFSIGPQSLELFMRIEYQGGPWKTAGLSRAVGVRANNVKGLARETVGKVRIKRIARNILVLVEIFPVGAMQLPELPS